MVRTAPAPRSVRQWCREPVYKFDPEPLRTPHCRHARKGRSTHSRLPPPGLRAGAVTHVAMEATGVYWKPVWAVLVEDFELLLANARHVKTVPGRKTDVNDAVWLADLLAHGLIRPSFVPPPAVQALRDLTC